MQASDVVADSHVDLGSTAIGCAADMYRLMHVDDEVNDEAQRLAALVVRPRAICERRRETHDGGEHIAFRRIIWNASIAARACASPAPGGRSGKLM